ALLDKNGRKMPQAIAHRGYKDKHPENSMAAFVGAVDVGSDAIETDVHLSRDGVVVLSHDPTLNRCFGKPDKLIDCDWSYLSTLRTVDEPHERMPRLADLLEYLTQPGHEHVWVLLDIKIDNNLDDVMRLIAATIASVPPAPDRPWEARIVIGVWSPRYLPFTSAHLPNFPLTYIGFSLPMADQYLSVPAFSFNLFQPILVGPLGASFLRKARKHHRPVFDWTVNKENAMRWSVEKGLDGVVTDDPKRFLEVRGEFGVDGGKMGRRAWRGWEWKEWWWLVKMQVTVWVMMIYIWRVFGPWRVDRRFKTA
ncbi:PLC-like phosphodiesterase, partial [Saccharata proteae CBS 121410]